MLFKEGWSLLRAVIFHQGLDYLQYYIHSAQCTLHRGMFSYYGWMISVTGVVPVTAAGLVVPTDKVLPEVVLTLSR